MDSPGRIIIIICVDIERAVVRALTVERNYGYFTFCMVIIRVLRSVICSAFIDYMKVHRGNIINDKISYLAARVFIYIIRDAFIVIWA